MVDFKYKVTDIAKDFGISTKRVIETFAELTGETRKTGATFEENEVNALMEALTRETAVKDLGEYLASGKEPQPVKQETKKPEAKPQAKKELVRIVRSPEGEVSVDLTGKRSGRGAYLCPSAACLAKARKAKRLEHAFGVPVPDEVFERLTEEMACAEQAVKEAMPRGE